MTALGTRPLRSGTRAVAPPMDRRPRHPHADRWVGDERRWSRLVLAPSMIGLVIFYQIAAFGMVLVSVSDYRGAPEVDLVGWDNYAFAFGAASSRAALVNTLRLVAMVVPTSLVLGFTLALLLRRVRRGGWFYRSALLFPAVTMPTAAGVIWQWMLRPDDGVVNLGLGLFGVEPHAWLSNPTSAPIAVAAMTCWQYTGILVVIFLAALRRIPADVHEAAVVDGAGIWQQTTRITLPLMAPTVAVNAVIMTLVSGLSLGSIVALTPNGGPRGANRTLGFEIHRQLFDTARFGRAAALTTVLLVLVMALGGSQLWLSRRFVNYGDDDRSGML